MTKVNLKYNKDGSLRPFPNRKIIEEMTEKEISEEQLSNIRNQENTLNHLLKVNKSILLWIQIFGFTTIALIIIYAVIIIFNLL